MLVVVSAGLVLALSGSVASAGPVWVVYHGNAARTGNDTTEPSFLPLRQAWKAALDGRVYAQPLVVAGRVFAVTENDTVYALDAHDGHVLWQRHVGTPMTNVVAQVGCGNIDPLGITSTPVINATANIAFVVATIQDANQIIHHQLIGLDVTTGAVRVSANADPGGVQNPLYIQQRAGLAMGNGRVYVGYGGYSGDCGSYHGWMVSLTQGGTGKVAFDVTPNTRQGAIWETGGPAIDAGGDLFVGTGNPNPNVATGDYGESVLKFDPTLHLLHNFSNSNATADFDFGTTTPALVGGNMVFEIGKQNIGYLLDAGDLHELQHLTVCPTSEAKGADAFDGSHLYVPCDAGIREVNVDTVNRSMSLGWTGPSTSHAGPPILAGGALWSVDWGNARLYALSATTGATMSGFPIAIDPTPHFAGPSAALGLLLVGTNSGVSAFDGPNGPPPPAFGAPTAVKATPGNARATIRWTAPTNPSGSPVTSYTVTPFIGTTAQTSRVFTSTATTEVVTGLTNATTYTFRVAASTAHGIGPRSAPTAAITVGAPTAPTAPKAASTSTTTTTGSLIVSYTAGANNGATITSFTATCTSSNGGVTKSGAHVGATATPIAVGGVTTTKTYTCVVKATNSRGTSPASSASPPVIVGSPAAPTAPTVTKTSAGSLKVTFTPPASNGASITSYTTTCTSSNGGLTNSATGAASPITVTGLTTTKTYTCTVKAANSRGAGPPSPASAAVTA